jgi:hypothetical protein
MMATACPPATGSFLSSTASTRGPSGAGLLQRGMSEAMAEGTLDMWVAYG